MSANVLISIVVPCYNEEEVLPETARRLSDFFTRLVESGKVNKDSKVLFVDDGSSDKTWKLIESLSASDEKFSGVKLSRNRGHQNALLAGLLEAKGDAIISIDADLQDDINAIEEMLDHFLKGCDIVYGIRKERTTDTVFKRLTAEGYYKLLHFFGVDVRYNHADFRLMSRRAIEALREYKEVNLFLRGIVPTIGFKTAEVFYARSDRFAGESKYPLKKMFALAFNGIISFSPAPLRYIALLGVLISLASLGMIFWVLWIKFVAGEAIPGWASSVIPIYFLGGIQLLSFGVVGEYIAKLYEEAKKRPRYIIEKSSIEKK